MAATPVEVFMYDSAAGVNVVPGSARYFLAYIVGQFANYTAACEKFGADHVLSISTVAGVDADGCDIEPGCMTFEEGAQFVLARQARGLPSFQYFSISNLSGVEAANAAAGVKNEKLYFFFADYNNIPVIQAGASADQFATAPPGDDSGYDTSLVFYSMLEAFNPSLIPPAPTPPVPKTQEVQDLFATDGKKVYRLSVYTPADMQKGNTTVEQWREFDRTQAEVEAAGFHVWDSSILAMWVIHTPSNA